MAASESALIAKYFGRAAAASARTPPAARVIAALSGGLFRSTPALAPAHISTAHALELLHQEHVLFVDTRDPGEVANSGFVPGALRIPRHMLLLRSEALNQPDSQIVAYGTTEAKSMQAGEMLRAMGFQDVSVMASYRHWVDAGGPIQLPSQPQRPIGVPAAALV